MFDWLSEADIESMTKNETDSFPGWCRMVPAVDTQDETGADIRTYPTPGPVIRCDIVPLSEDEYANASASREEVLNTYIISLPAHTETKSTDRVQAVSVDENYAFTAVLYQFEIVQPGLADPIETGIEVLGQLVQ